MSQTINLGSVTAYASAVEGGYTGTYAEFCEATANVAEVGELQADTMPTASADRVGQVVQYIGATGGGYTHGYFYECVNNNETYSWQNVAVQVDQAGHTIVDSSDTEMTQRSKLKFIGATVTDDSTNTRTKIDVSNASDYTITFTDASADAPITTGSALKTIVSLIKYKLGNLIPKANIDTTGTYTTDNTKVISAKNFANLKTQLSSKRYSIATTTSSWVQTSVGGITYYKYTVNLNPAVGGRPKVALCEGSSTFPTDNEKTAWDLVKYITVDDNGFDKLYLYATARPSTAYYIAVTGCGGNVT